MSVRYQIRSFLDFANSTTIANYALINSRVSYTTPRFRMLLFLNNLTKTAYFTSGYMDVDGKRKLFVQAPANGYVSVSYRL